MFTYAPKPPDTNSSKTVLERKRERNRRWYLNNREKARESVRRWQENNRERRRENLRRWYLKNREKVRERSRLSYLNNPEKAREKARENLRRWRTTNPEKVRADNRKRTLRPYGLTLADFEALNRKQNGLCGICHKPCSKHKVLSVDHCHKTGRVRGLLCSKCNKGLGLFDEDFSTLIRAANHIGWRSN